MVIKTVRERKGIFILRLRVLPVVAENGSQGAEICADLIHSWQLSEAEVRSQEIVLSVLAPIFFRVTGKHNAFIINGERKTLQLESFYI